MDQHSIRDSTAYNADTGLPSADTVITPGAGGMPRSVPPGGAIERQQLTPQAIALIDDFKALDAGQKQAVMAEIAFWANGTGGLGGSGPPGYLGTGG